VISTFIILWCLFAPENPAFVSVRGVGFVGVVYFSHLHLWDIFEYADSVNRKLCSPFDAMPLYWIPRPFNISLPFTITFPVCDALAFIILWCLFGTASVRWCKHTTKFRIHNTWIKNNLKNVDTSVKNPPSIYLTFQIALVNFGHVNEFTPPQGERQISLHIFGQS